ncbi:flagellar export protein FliJ [Planomicrobium sp. CPCC 101079]|uniref:flagellar export protein FliJ n=1 Tax=Planomicrobium sp. CPCC 101079 TaxID=2599618 RepID=UPI0011B6ABFB|nr:flagellar export protein FliJ [Planomicrobium sp. CPCC 101079]TWT03695.1 flagellar export protein FliJ [Planomicrobium sp. CPCC 101079]
MTKFNFRFQKILDIKGNEKGFAQIQMADAMKQEEVGYQKKEAIYNMLLDAELLKKEKQQEGVNISELRMMMDYIQQLQDQLVMSNRELERLQNNVKKSQNNLQEKAQEEKTWDNLKQQKFVLFEEQIKAEEQIFFDEIASTRFFRNMQATAAERG